MVVIMGWGGGDTKDLGEVAPASCPTCHNQVFLHQLHSTKQFSLYFIPLGNYSSNDYLACPICRQGLQLRKEHVAVAQRMRLALSGRHEQTVHENEARERRRQVVRRDRTGHGRPLGHVELDGVGCSRRRRQVVGERGEELERDPHRRRQDAACARAR